MKNKGWCGSMTSGSAFVAGGNRQVVGNGSAMATAEVQEDVAAANEAMAALIGREGE